MSAFVPLDVRSSGVRLHVERWGDTGPTLVLGHGFGGSARNFRPQARALAGSCRVVLFDARGHARSDAPADRAEYVPERFVGDLGAVLDAAGVERAIVGGLSMGAGVALRFALAHPERVSALVLSAFPRAVDEPAHVPWALGFADAIDRDGLEAAGEQVIWGRFDPKTADLVRRGFVEHPPHALSSILRELIAAQPAPRDMAGLAELGVPTLVIVGSEDPPSLRPCRELAERIPGAELVVIAGGGHIVNLTHSAEYNAAVWRFVDKLARAGPDSR